MSCGAPRDGTTDILMRQLLLNRDQVAALLGVPAKTVDYLHRMRQLPAVRVGKFNIWKPQTLREFVDLLEPKT